MLKSEIQGLVRSPLASPRIEAIWIAAARALGWRIERQDSAYASSDGRGAIVIGVDEILDDDDAVAQLVFHELCHGLNEGPEGWSAPDWGLSNVDSSDTLREHACLRIQIHLAESHGLRELMAPTTAYRAYHDAIAGDPLWAPLDASATLARAAIDRPASRYWVDILNRALHETRAVLDEEELVQGQNRGASMARIRIQDGTPPEGGDSEGRHPVGFAFAPDAAASQETCGTCAWHYKGGRGRPVERCRQSAEPDGDGRRTSAAFRACVVWEAKLDCQTCGACCREAYHSVTVSMRDPVVWKQPELIVRNGHRFEIRRHGDRCAALEDRSPAVAEIDVPVRQLQARRSPAVSGGFSCAIYEDRPHPCRDFEAGGRHCLVARHRVGLGPRSGDEDLR